MNLKKNSPGISKAPNCKIFKKKNNLVEIVDFEKNSENISKDSNCGILNENSVNICRA